MTPTSEHDDVVERRLGKISPAGKAYIRVCSELDRLRLSLKEKDAEIQSIRAATIEECAKMAEAAEVTGAPGMLVGRPRTAREIAVAIRSLSKEKP